MIKLSVILSSLLVISLQVQAGDIVIYDASLNPLAGIGEAKGVKVLVNGKKRGSIFNKLMVTDDARRTSDNLTTTRDFFLQRFGRDSFDGKGGVIEAIVRIGRLPIDLFGLKQNAAWDGKKFLFGGGESKGLKWFNGATDVIAHEYTHAVIQYTSNLEYQGQSGALNEHFADLFGQMVQVQSGRGPDDFLIGESILADGLRAEISKKRGYSVLALRDMLNPNRGLDSQPAHMSEVPASLGRNCVPSMSNDRCGVHTLSGIPNRAAALMISQLGWSRMSPIFYNVMTSRLKAKSKFADYVSETMAECYKKLTPAECAVVNSSFKAVGL